MMDRLIDAQTLLDLAVKSSAITAECLCLQRNLEGWSSWPVGYREEAFVELGTLAKYPAEEAVIDEYHPEGTTYWSPSAPIAPLYYPYNQCTVWSCGACKRIYIRHNDDGAYHVERRIRFVRPALVIDAPHATGGLEQR
ncbi:hypothetical protein [Pseudomonas gingeri]|uniref:hypothetical protein n=1 Tax=Pseudomonas gingeri TaxID=117681 RepID=UPI0015A3D96B|nr:hypothetical protein [Pseudomonas gingeri]NWD07932.1 hypothetical protein [Pseudomonas gingeri]NWE59264.1 hypothetical protein [Pseudomonas gingeri]NWF01467.1 hypothetical protein [Pseudomonas gingeri]